MGAYETMRDNWAEFVEPFEGKTNWLYLDTKGLPTTGIGNLMGSNKSLYSVCLALPWRYKSGEYALESEIEAEFKHMKELRLYGSGFAYEKHAKLFLDNQVVRELVAGKLDSNQDVLKKQMPGYPDTWPIEAMYVLNNMAWHMGPYFLTAGDGWPNLRAFLKKRDFWGASTTCREGGKQDTPRNNKSVELFQRAHLSTLMGVDPNKMFAGYIDLQRFRSDAGQARVVQFALSQSKHYQLALDGVWGPKSEEAFIKYTNDYKNKNTRESLERLVKVWNETEIAIF